MQGIAGIISKKGVDPGATARMARCLALESFHTIGTYDNAALNLAIGWSSFDGEEGPVWNDARDLCLFLCGHAYVDDAGSDGRALLTLYAGAGADCFEKLNGNFSGLLIDLRRREVVLFNDRYGMSRVYFCETADSFCFASQAKALIDLLPELRRLDMRGVAETVSCGCVLQNRTLFSGVSLLPGAARWTFHPEAPLRKEVYFDRRRWEEQAPLDEAQFYDVLKQTFTRILPKYLVSREPLAMSLTGGLDGRMIMAWAGAAPGALPCYTFAGPYRDCVDAIIARRIAAVCGQEHETIRVEDDFFPAFPALAEKTILASDGAMDVTGAVEIYVNARARRIAPIRLTGNYGSEILRGNIAFRPAKNAAGPFDGDFLRLVGEAAETYDAERASVPAVSFVAFKQTPWHHYARLSIEQSQLRVRSPYLDNELVALMCRAPASALASSAPSLRLIHEGNPALAKLPTDRGRVYRDETRMRRLLESLIGFSIKAEYAYDYGMPQSLARIDHAIAFLRPERLFLGWHKFYHFRVWYRDQLSQYVRDTLLDSRALNRDYIDRNTLERMVQDHVAGRRNWTREISRVLSLELTQRLLIER